MNKDKDVSTSGAWAAYVLGHDLWSLDAWQSSVWMCRQLAEEGHAEFKVELPGEIASIEEAMESFVTEAGGEKVDAVRIGKLLAEWEAASLQMLREIPQSKYESEIDWDADSPPGARPWREIVVKLNGMMASDPLMQQWFLVGQTMFRAATHRSLRFTEEETRDLRDELQALWSMEGYEFIEPVVKLLAEPSGPVAPALGGAIDPVLGFPTLGRIESYIRSSLKKGARTSPIIKLSPDTFVLYGVVIPKDNFRRAEWIILRSLCEKPKEKLSRRTLIRRSGLKCGPEGIPPHVARIRAQLRPIIDSRFAGMDMDSSARSCFIVGLEDENKSYALDVSPKLVLVEPEA